MNFHEDRKDMVNRQLRPRGINDEKVINSFLRVPRERFVPERARAFSYADSPLSIGEGQTISQPYIVALMTQSLKLKAGDKVLEIGAGSGYQAAILADMGCKVYAIERRPGLAKKAEKILRELGYDIKIKVGDGTLGWKELSPFAGIVVTAAGPRVPESLFAQLEEKGRMVIPVGDLYYQELMLITRINGREVTENLGGCRFVALQGKEAWPENERY